MIRASLLMLLLLPGAAAAAPCSESIKAVKGLAADARKAEAAAIAVDQPGSELAAARAWHTAQSRAGTATDALSGIDRSTCSSAQSAEIANLIKALSTKWHDAETKFQEHRLPACSKLVADSRAEAEELAELKLAAEPQVYAESGMGHEYKMIWRVSLAKAFDCQETRELFDTGRAMSRDIHAYLGVPKADSCTNARKIAQASKVEEDPLGFITFAHVALHYAGCDSEALLESDTEFRELYQKYQALAPQLYGSVYD